MSKKTLSKKEQFTQKEKSRLPLILAISTGVIVLVLLFVVYGGQSKDKVAYFGEPVASTRSYIGEFVSMTEVSPVIEDGEIRIPLDVVDQNNIVKFEIENNEGLAVPLMAYITPSGRLFAGSSMCEPCRGRTFSLAGETLVCDTCRTTYTIEEHTFIAGAQACGAYPPVNMNPEIVDGTVIINLDEVLNWRIRS